MTEPDIFSDDNLPVPKDFPKGPDTNEVLKVVAPPVGIPTDQFRDVCNALVWNWYHSKGSAAITPENLSRYTKAGKPLSIIKKVMESPAFADFAARRGISLSDHDKLDERQLLALQVISDISSKGTLKYRLNKIGVSWFEYQAWLKNPSFAAAQRKISEDSIKEAIPLAKMKLAEKSADGQMDAIKYMFEISGEHDPNKRQILDVQALMRAIVDVLSKHLAPTPDLARAIGADIALVAAQFGIGEKS